MYYEVKYIIEVYSVWEYFVNILLLWNILFKNDFHESRGVGKTV